MGRDQGPEDEVLQAPGWNLHLAYPGKASRGEAAAAAIPCLILFTSHQDNVTHFMCQIALPYKGGRELGKFFPTLILESYVFFLLVKSLIDNVYILRTGHKSEVYIKFHAHNAPCTHHSTRKKNIVCTQKRFPHLPGAPSISMWTLAPYASSACRICTYRSKSLMFHEIS